MTPDELALVIPRLGWTETYVAELLSCDDGLVRQWCDGRTAIPPAVVSWLVDLRSAHDAHPPPVGWRVRRRAVA